MDEVVELPVPEVVPLVLDFEDELFELVPESDEPLLELVPDVPVLDEPLVLEPLFVLLVPELLLFELDEPLPLVLEPLFVLLVPELLEPLFALLVPEADELVLPDFELELSVEDSLPVVLEVSVPDFELSDWLVASAD